jgi:dihydrofolate reductase
MAIFASSDLALTLLRAKLIDEFQIIVIPIFVGSGNSLFKGLDQRIPLKLVGTKVFGSGVVILTYRLD